MACNVYLSFFRQFDAAELRALEWRYLGACYGIPFIPAFVFLFIDSAGRGKVYGNAVVCPAQIAASRSLMIVQLWCWVTSKWRVLRIATFYGPVWLIILVTVFIYIKVGTVVFAWRKQLISQSRSENKSEMIGNRYPMREFPVSPSTLTSPTSPSAPQKTYEVTISSQVPHSPNSTAQYLSSPRSTYYGDSTSTEPHRDRLQSIHETAFPATHTNVIVERPQIRTLDANRATISYCKTAMLFFLALLCTW